MIKKSKSLPNIKLLNRYPSLSLENIIIRSSLKKKRNHTHSNLKDLVKYCKNFNKSFKSIRDKPNKSKSISNKPIKCKSISNKNFKKSKNVSYGEFCAEFPISDRKNRRLVIKNFYKNLLKNS